MKSTPRPLAPRAARGFTLLELMITLAVAAVLAAVAVPNMRDFLRNSRLTNIGKGNRNKTGGSVYLHGVQLTKIADNQFTDSAPVTVEHTVGDPRTFIEDNQFKGTNAPVINDDKAILRNNSLK